MKINKNTTIGIIVVVAILLGLMWHFGDYTLEIDSHRFIGTWSNSQTMLKFNDDGTMVKNGVTGTWMIEDAQIFFKLDHAESYYYKFAGGELMLSKTAIFNPATAYTKL